jgi:hypothetical protein
MFMGHIKTYCTIQKSGVEFIKRVDILANLIWIVSRIKRGHVAVNSFQIIETSLWNKKTVSHADVSNQLKYLQQSYIMPQIQMELEAYHLAQPQKCSHL